MWLVLFNEFLFSLRCSFTWSATLICNGSSSTPVCGSKKLAASWASDVLAINLSCAQKSDLACIKAVLGRISKWFLNSAGISNVILNAALALLFYSLFLRKFWWITKTTCLFIVPVMHSYHLLIQSVVHANFQVNIDILNWDGHIDGRRFGVYLNLIKKEIFISSNKWIQLFI